MWYAMKSDLSSVKVVRLAMWC